jgi:hypothetical protein
MPNYVTFRNTDACIGYSNRTLIYMSDFENNYIE